MSDGSEYVSNHDRGAFGRLMAECKDMGVTRLAWDVDLSTDLEDRWVCWVPTEEGHDRDGATGRTGEEAFRRLVEKLRVARGVGQA